MSGKSVNSPPDYREAANEFLRLVASGRVREAFRRYVGQEFRHHNPYFRGDAESLAAAMEEDAAANPDKVLEIHRSLRDGDLVAVHSRIRRNPVDPGGVAVHIFRFRENLIVELWDIWHTMPENSPNEHGMF